MKKLQPDKLEPKSEKCVFIGYPKDTVGYTFYHRSEGKIFVAENGSCLEKDFLLKGVSGRKVELDEVTIPAPLLEIIHTDICGLMSVEARGGYHYFLTFTNDLSRYGYVYLMKHKSETFEKFKEFQSEVENHRNKKIKFLRSDRGGEYLSYEFGLHLKQ